MLFVAGLAIILLFTLVGAMWARLVFPGASGIGSVGVGFPLATGLFTLVTFVLSIAKVPLPWAFACASTLMVLSVIAIWAVTRRHDRPERDHLGEHSGAGPTAQESALSFVIASVLLALLGSLAVGRSYSTWDAIAIWSTKGYGISLEGSVLAAQSWGSHGMTYPLNLPVLIALFRDLGLESLPASKLIFPSFFLSMLLVCYDYGRSQGIRVVHALLGITALATVPLIFEHATIGYANLPFTTYLTMAVVLVAVGIQLRNLGALILGGLSIGLATWTRPEGLLLSLIGSALVTIYMFRQLEDKKQIFAWLTPIVLVGGVWGFANLRYGVTSLLGNTLKVALKSIAAGDFNLPGVVLEVRYLGGQLLDFKVWGLLFPMAVLLLAANGRHVLEGIRGPKGALFVAALGYGVPVLGFYYLLTFRGNALYWLDTGLNRMLMPAAVIGFLWIVFLSPVSLGDLRSANSKAS